MRVVIFLLSFFFAAAAPVFAIIDPLAVPNNRYGIHITDAHDIDRAAELVNSTGGDWGYVTLVMTQNHRNQKEWQQLFDLLRERHLIPIIRLATEPQGDVWQKPNVNQAGDWANFLNSLNWVVKNRYIILFNEPNHAKEWGGEIKPHEYVAIVNAFIPELKKQSTDFFILPAGFDLSAPNGPETMDVVRYYQLMSAFDPEIFTRFDGWSTHSYPNPGYAASPGLSGKTSLRGYQWEQNLLKAYHHKPNLPIFITETGWNKDNLPALRRRSINDQLVANWDTAFQSVWTDSNIVAITPFLLRYLNPPFTGFSWLDPVTDEPLPHYLSVQSLPKNRGEPIQEDSNRIDNLNLPSELVAQSHYQFTLSLMNTGQTIWDPSNYAFLFDHHDAFVNFTSTPLETTPPLKSATVTFTFTTPVELGIYPITFSFTKDHVPFGESITRVIKIIPPPSLLVKLQLWYKKLSSGNDFTLLIYKNGLLTKTITSITLTMGTASIRDLYDIVPGATYRFVITKPYYLPRQTYAIINSSQTNLTFDRLLPLDFYPDGQFNRQDLWFAFRHPLTTLKLLSL